MARGSRILVDLPPGDEETAGAAFYVARSGNPRISSVEFVNFCIDGLHFASDGSGLHPENTYVNGKSGIHVADANDSFRVNGMGFIYLEHALTVHNADALSVHDNFIAECGNCIELRGWGQASKITDNLIGAGFNGHSIYAEHHGGLLITANNVFPRGASSVRLNGVTKSSVTNNRLHSFYPGMVVLEASSENLVGSNHFLRDHEPWSPFFGVDNGLDDDFGLLTLSGSDNSVIGNHFSATVDADRVRPAGAAPVIIRLQAGGGTTSPRTTSCRWTFAAGRAAPPTRRKSTPCSRPMPRSASLSRPSRSTRSRSGTRSSIREPNAKSASMSRRTLFELAPQSPLKARECCRDLGSVAYSVVGGDWIPREPRHTFVSLMSDGGASNELIADLVGHGNTTTRTVHRHQLRPVITKGAELLDEAFGKGFLDDEATRSAPSALGGVSVGGLVRTRGNKKRPW
ncbi:hypothetical protein GCM10029992_11500 [Glycomyces albus]